MDDAMLADLAAERLHALVTRATPGDWRTTGLLATRPEVVAVRPDGSSEHVAEARAGSAPWITTVSPAVGPALVAVLRAAAERSESAAEPLPAAVLELARQLLARLPEQPRTSSKGA